MEAAGEDKFNLQDFTVMKLMEEIVEFDQEIKMKQKWINTRINMLHQIQMKHPNPQVKSLTHEFLQKIQPEYPQKLSVEYKREGEIIPLKMNDKYPDPIPMEMGQKHDVIPLMSRDRAESGEPKIEVIGQNE